MSAGVGWIRKRDSLGFHFSSKDFRARVLALCKEAIIASGPRVELTEDQINEIVVEIDTYWDNIKREYGNQMTASKRDKRKQARAKDRRRARLERVSRDDAQTEQRAYVSILH